MDDDFKWHESQSVVIPQQDAIAVYQNPDGDVVIRQRTTPDRDEDWFIVLHQSMVPRLIDALRAVTEPDAGGE